MVQRTLFFFYLNSLPYGRLPSTAQHFIRYDSSRLHYCEQVRFIGGYLQLYSLSIRTSNCVIFSPDCVDGWLGIMVGSQLWHSLFDEASVSSTARDIASYIDPVHNLHSAAKSNKSYVNNDRNVENASLSALSPDVTQHVTTVSLPLDKNSVYQWSWDYLNDVSKQSDSHTLVALLGKLGLSRAEELAWIDEEAEVGLRSCLKPVAEKQFGSMMAEARFQSRGIPKSKAMRASSADQVGPTSVSTMMLEAVRRIVREELADQHHGSGERELDVLREQVRLLEDANMTLRNENAALLQPLMMYTKGGVERLFASLVQSTAESVHSETIDLLRELLRETEVSEIRGNLETLIMLMKSVHSKLNAT